MEVVIKIPDEVLESRHYCQYFGVWSTKLTEAIENGTVLPKGHGRLIDADCLNTGCGIRAFDCVGDCDKCSDRVVSYNEIENAETIVEADRG